MVYIIIFLIVQALVLVWFFNWLLDVIKQLQDSTLKGLNLTTQNAIEVAALEKLFRRLEDRFNQSERILNDTGHMEAFKSLEIVRRRLNNLENKMNRVYKP